MGGRGPILLLVGLLAALAAFALRRFDVVEVRGRSMIPTLLPGDRLLVVRLSGRPRSGDVVLTADPRDPGRELIKRVASTDRLGVRLAGDNPAESTDARAFGLVDPAAIGWRVLARYWPPARAGGVPAAPLVIEEGGELACPVPDALVAGD